MKIWRVQKGTKYIQSDCARYCDGGQELFYQFKDQEIVFVNEYFNEGVDELIENVKTWDFENQRDTLLIGEVEDEYVRDAEDEDGYVALWNVALWNKIKWKKVVSF